MRMKLHRLTIDLPDDIYKKFKIKCVSQDKTVREAIIEAIKLDLTEEIVNDHISSMRLFNIVKLKCPIMKAIGECTDVYFLEDGIWEARCTFSEKCMSEPKNSLRIVVSKDIFYCFSCHASGDQISYIARHEKCSQIEAAYILLDLINP